MRAKAGAQVVHTKQGVRFTGTIHRTHPITKLVTLDLIQFGRVVVNDGDWELLPSLHNLLLYTPDLDPHYASSDDHRLVEEQRDLENALMGMCSRLPEHDKQLLETISSLNIRSKEAGYSPVTYVTVGLAK